MNFDSVNDALRHIEKLEGALAQADRHLDLLEEYYEGDMEDQSAEEVRALRQKISDLID